MELVECPSRSRPRRPELGEAAGDGGTLSEQGSAGVEQPFGVVAGQRAADGQAAQPAVGLLVAGAALVQVVVAELIERRHRTRVEAHGYADRVGQRKCAHGSVCVSGRVDLAWHRRVAGSGQ